MTTLSQVEDDVTDVRNRGGGGRTHGWRMCGSDTAVGWVAETRRKLHITFNSDQQINLRDVAQPDIGAWIRFARKYASRLVAYLLLLYISINLLTRKDIQEDNEVYFITAFLCTLSLPPLL